MRIAYPQGSFLDISCGAGTAGTGDVVLGIRFRCEGASGESRPYFERADIEAFVLGLECLLDGSRAEVLANSDNADASLSVKPLDLVGHFGVEVGLTFRLSYRGVSLPCSAVGAFELESAQLEALRKELGTALRADG